MRPTTEFKTTKIPLAAVIMTATNKKPLLIKPGRDAVEFVFRLDDAVEAVVMRYSSGKLLQDVLVYESNRFWLYRQVRQFDLIGREVRP